MSRVLVTGIPRSGTRHLAEVLPECGIDAHHERVFSVNGAFLNSWTGVEISWMAAPYLKRPWLDGYRVLQLTRHPEASVRSLVHNNFVYFERSDSITLYREFAVAHVPEIRWPEDWAERVIAFVEAWGVMMAGLPRMKVEEPHAVAEVMGIDVARFDEATAAVGEETNHWNPTVPLELRPDLRTRLDALVTAWDYEPGLTDG